MIEKKKGYLILVAILILASALTACGDSSSPDPTAVPPSPTDTPLPPPPISTLDKFISPDGSFSVAMPDEPQELIQTIDTLVGPVEMIMYMSEVDFTTAYAVAYGDYPEEMITSSDPEDMLDGARDGAVSNIAGTLLNETSISYNGYPGRDLEIISSDGTLSMRAQIYLVENRLYQILLIFATKDGSPANADSFFNSFTLLDQ